MQRLCAEIWFSLILCGEVLDTATPFSKTTVTLVYTLAGVEALANPFPHIPNQQS